MLHHFKYIFLVMLLSVAAIVHSGACIQDGMNLWRLSENIACSVGSYCEITAANFSTSITTSGHYKLCGDIVGSGSDVIEIAASNVILDLGEYSLNGVSITIFGGVKNVIVRNETITNGPRGITLFGNGSAQADILIENILIDTISNALTINAGIVADGDITGLTVRNVAIYNGSPTNIYFSNIEGSYERVLLENISCINTNSAFVTIPSNPSAVIYIQSCDNLVMRNISLIDQWQELNGILLDTCTGVEVEGVTITSTLNSPTGFTTAYQTTNGGRGVHKNLFIDGGTHNVYNNGIVNSGATSTTFDSCLVQSIHGTGLTSGNGSMVLNSVALSCGTAGFITGANVHMEDCIANTNTNIGYNVQGTNSTYVGCMADRNLDGFFIAGNGCSFDFCSANNNAIGFEIEVSNGCFITNSIANDNTVLGFLIQGVLAESTFSMGAPADNTWNIGQFAATNPAHVSNLNVRLANNTAFRNASGGFTMSGTVYDTVINASTTFGPIPIFPPIGVVNTIQGAIYNDPKPKPNTSVGAPTGVVSAPLANAIGGNLVNDIPASDI